MLDGLCSDRTAAPDDLLACRPLLDGTEPTSLDTKYVVPDACWSIIAASR